MNSDRRRRGPARIARVFAYAWALPTTLVGAGFAAAATATGGRAALVDGVLEAHGGVLDLVLRRLVPLRGGASAMALGHVIVARNAGCLERTRAHERAHVRQAERWGVLFIPAYFASSVVAAMRGGHYYRDNRFERDAVEQATAGARRATLA
jgi:hypothetical protein